LGKEVIAKLVALSKSHAKIILYSVPGREPLYAKFGFVRMRTAWRSSGIASPRWREAICPKPDCSLQNTDHDASAFISA
jgi:hypothetical protein